jgi:hypothetical protein
MYQRGSYVSIRKNGSKQLFLQKGPESKQVPYRSQAVEQNPKGCHRHDDIEPLNAHPVDVAQFRDRFGCMNA